MIESIVVKSDHAEEEIRLMDANPSHGLLITSIDGLGPPTSTINTSGLANMDGTIFNSAFCNNRNIVISLLLLEKPDIETVRQRSYLLFPIKKEVTIIIKTTNRRLITKGRVESNTPDIFSKQETMQVSIVCSDPYLYTEQSSITTLALVRPLFEFPFSNESLDENLIEFSSLELTEEHVLHYPGEFDVGIIIHLHFAKASGDVTVYNTNTRDHITLLSDRVRDGIQAGDDIQISSVSGDKYIRLIREGSTFNILNAMSKDSSWITITNGDNLFAYVSSYGMDGITFKIENRIAYSGV